MKLVVVGLGSELMGDDAAGLKVIDIISRYKKLEDVDFKKCYSTGFEIMESIEGYDAAIIVDTISTGKHKIGEVIKIEPQEIRYSNRISSFHDFDLLTSIELGKRLGLKIPYKIEIYGIEIRQSNNFSEEISFEVRSAIDSLVSIILLDIQRLGFEIRNPGLINGGSING